MAGRKRSFNGKLPIASEDEEQKALVKWLILNHILFYHVPNGGKRSFNAGRRLVALGMQAGVPDICIPLSRHGYGAMYVEMKRTRGGVVSDVQQQWIEALTKAGNYVIVARGCMEAMEAIKKYLGM